MRRTCVRRSAPGGSGRPDRASGILRRLRALEELPDQLALALAHLVEVLIQRILADRFCRQVQILDLLELRACRLGDWPRRARIVLCRLRWRRLDRPGRAASNGPRGAATGSGLGSVVAPGRADAPGSTGPFGWGGGGGSAPTGGSDPARRGAADGGTPPAGIAPFGPIPVP